MDQSLGHKSKLKQSMAGVALFGLSVLCLWLVAVLPLQSNRSLELDFSYNVQTDILLVYAGYAGCAGICPRALSRLAQMQNTHTGSVQVLFLDLDPHSTENASQAYARQFHSAFLGLHTGSPGARQLTDVLFPASNVEEIDFGRHKDSLFMLRREQDNWHLVQVYPDLNIDYTLVYKKIRDYKNGTPEE